MAKRKAARKQVRKKAAKKTVKRKVAVKKGKQCRGPSGKGKVSKVRKLIRMAKRALRLK